MLMGSLAITRVPANTKTTNSSGTPLKNNPGQPQVYADIKIGDRAFRYLITGVSLQNIPRIPMLVPWLEHLLRREIGIDDSDHGVPRQLTFSEQGITSDEMTIAASFRGLDNLFKAAIKSGKSDITALRVDSSAQILFKEEKATNVDVFGLFTIGPKSGFEELPLTFSKIKPIHFSNLTFLEVLVLPGSTTILKGMRGLFEEECFPKLKTLRLSSSGKDPRGKNGQSELSTFKEQRALREFYEGLLKAKKLPPIKRLELLLWCDDVTQAGLAVLKRLCQEHDTLRELKVNLSLSTGIVGGLYVSDTQRYRESYLSSGAFGDRLTELTYDKPTFSKAVHIADESNAPTVVSVLKEMKQNKLKSVEIQNGSLGGKDIEYSQFDYRALSELILSDSLKNLKRIKIMPPVQYYAAHFNQIDAEQEIIDTTDLLAAVIKQKVLLEELELGMPEKQGFQQWLDRIVEDDEGLFSLLTHFLWFVPVKEKKEAQDVYELRIEKGLQTILKAVTTGKMPRVSSLVITGFGNGITLFDERIIPNRFKSTLTEIQVAVAKQNQARLTASGSSSLSTSSEEILPLQNG